MSNNTDTPVLCDYITLYGIDKQYKLLDNTNNKPLYNLQWLHSKDTQYNNDYNKVEYTLCGSECNLSSSGLDLLHSTVYLYKSYVQHNDEAPICDIKLIHDKHTVEPDYTLMNNDINKGTINKSTYIAYKRCSKNTDVPLRDVGFINTKLRESLDSNDTQWHTHNQSINNTYQLYMQHSTTNLLQHRFKSATYSTLQRNNHTNTELQQTIDSIHHYCYPAGVQLYRTLQYAKYNTFVVTTQNGSPLYVSTLTTYNALGNNDLKHLDTYNSIDQSVLYQPITLCLISQYPYFQCMTQYLQYINTLLQQTQQSQLAQSIEFTLSLLFNTPLSRSTNVYTTIQCTSPNIDVKPYNTGLDFTLCNIDMSILFNTLSIQTIVKVYTSLLTERKIILHSHNAALLTPICETLKYLLYPLEWQYAYVPVCPTILHGILDAPMPVLVGLVCNTIDVYSFTALNDDCCIVNCDTDYSAVCGSELIQLPDVLIQRLISDLKPYVELIHNNTRTRKSVTNNNITTPTKSPHNNTMLLETPPPVKHTPIFNTVGIRACFLNMLITILNGMDDCLLFPVHSTNDKTELFAVDKYTQSKPTVLRTFVKTLCTTQMFNTLIEHKTYGHNNTTNKYEFFDKCCVYVNEYNTVMRTIAKHGTDSGLQPMPTLCEKLCNRQTNMLAVYKVPTTSNSNKNNVSYSYDTLTMLDQTLITVQQHTITNFHALNTSITATQLQQLYDTAFGSTASTLPTTPTNKQIAMEPLKYANLLLRTLYTIWFEYMTATIHTQSNIEQCICNVFIQLEYITSQQIQPDEHIYRAVLSICGQYNKKLEAAKIVDVMKKSGIKLNSLLYSAYNNAIQHNNRIDSNHNTTTTDNTHTIVWSTVQAGVDCVCTACHATMSESEILTQYLHSKYSATIQCIYCYAMQQQPTLIVVYNVMDTVTQEQRQCSVQCSYMSSLKVRRDIKQHVSSNTLSLHTLYTTAPTIHWNLLWHISNTHNIKLLDELNVQLQQYNAYDLRAKLKQSTVTTNQYGTVETTESTISPTSDNSDDFIAVKTLHTLDYDIIDVDNIQQQLEQYGYGDLNELSGTALQEYDTILTTLNYKIDDLCVEREIQQLLHTQQYKAAIDMFVHTRIKTRADSIIVNKDNKIVTPVKAVNTQFQCNRTCTLRRVGLRHIIDYFISLCDTSTRTDKQQYTQTMKQLYSTIDTLPVALKHELTTSEMYSNKYVYMIECILQLRGCCYNTKPVQTPVKHKPTPITTRPTQSQSSPTTPHTKTSSKLQSPSILTQNSMNERTISYNLTPNKTTNGTNVRRMSTNSMHKDTHKSTLSNFFDKLVDIVTEVPPQTSGVKPVIQMRKSMSNLQVNNVKR